MDSHEIKILTDRLIPVPKEIKFRDGREYPIAGKCKVAIHAAETGGISEKAEKLFKDYWNAEAEITLKQDASAKKLGTDAYKIKVAEKQLSISERHGGAPECIQNAATACRGSTRNGKSHGIFPRPM